MRRRGAKTLALVLGLALMPGSGAAQETERAAELEARQAERLRAREAQRPTPTGIRPPGWNVDPYGYRPSPYAPYGYGPFPSGALGTGADFGGYGHPGYFDPFAYRPGYPAFLGLPNPYEDWARLWGRGWLDDAAVPPYHRFQYRFFPETLPDPTREGYVRPGDWRVAVPYRPATVPPGVSCARIEISLGEESPETVLVRLPILGASTPAALRAVIADRLRGGAGVVVRDLEGYVVQLPAPASVQGLTVTGCH